MTQRILLLLDNKENARLLRERLAARHAAICVTEIEQNLSHPLDLIIVDGPTLNRAGAAIQARKQAETPLFLPILLIVSRQDAGLQTRQLWQSVDDLITLPVERLELSLEFFGDVGDQGAIRVELFRQSLSSIEHLVIIQVCIRSFLEFRARFVRDPANGRDKGAHTRHEILSV